MTPVEFIRAHTDVTTAPLVPEIILHLANEITPIWQASEDWLRSERIEPPFWAFAWPGAQALARHVLDHPHKIEGRRVLDFAAGCGLAAIACAMVGARADASDIDVVAIEATRLNAALNRMDVKTIARDVVGDECRWDLILCGDVCYEAPMTAHIVPWLRRMARSCEVWVADPGRSYCPLDGMISSAKYSVPTSAELENQAERVTTLFRMEG